METEAVEMELKEGEVSGKDATGILHNAKTRKGLLKQERAY